MSGVAMPPAEGSPCPSFDALLAHVDGALPPEDAARMQAHLATCDECLAVVAEAARALDPAPAAEASSIAPAPPSGARTVRRVLPRPGDRVGRYVLEEVLGRGAMGIVYSAHDPELARKVAVKLVRTGAAGANAPELEARLLGEAQAMARLAHPNVVAVFDLGVTEGGIYVAMERVAGETLRAHFAHGKHPWREILAAYLQAAEGLDAAHEAGIVHRDFKPDNALVDASTGRVRVTDFGLARMTAEHAGGRDLERSDLTSSDLHRTRAGTIIGTPAYMAPEQLGAAPVDRRADVFSFAASLYEALYGKRPYVGATLGELELSLRRGVPAEPPPSKVPAHVRRALLRALAGDPAQRFPTMRALITALQRDPLRRALLVAIPAAVVVIAGATAAFVWHLTTAPARGCRASAGVAASVWDEAQQGAAEAAFLATGKAFARDAFGGASAALSSWLESWRGERIAACDATHEDGTQSEALLDLRLGCLDQRLSEARALADTFTRADATVVERSAEAVSALAAPAICRETERLSARVPPPVDPGTQALVHEADERLAKAEAATLTGAFAAAKTLAEEARGLAERSGYAPSQAEAARLLADVALLGGDLDGTLSWAEEAMPHAAAAGDDRLMARAAIALGRAEGFKTPGGADGLRWFRLAAAHAARLPQDPALATEVRVQRASSYLRALKPAEALPDLEDAVARTAEGGAQVEPLTLLAQTHQQLERYPQAIATFRRALELARRALGPLHPKAFAVRALAASCMVSSGHYAAGLELASESLGLWRTVVAGDHADTATLLHIRGLALGGLGRYDEALASHREARAMEVRLFGEESAQVVTSGAFELLADIGAGRGEDAVAAADAVGTLVAKRFADAAGMKATVAMLRALALETAGRWDEARAAFVATEPEVRTALGGGTELAWTLAGLGRDALRRGDTTTALDKLTQADAILASHYEPESLERAATLADLGAAQLAAGRRDDARRTLERVVSMLDAEPSDPLLGASVRLDLAEALAGTDEARAAALRAKARELASGSPYPRAARIASKAAALP